MESGALLVQLGFRDVRISFYMSLGTVAFFVLLKLPDSIFKNKHTDKTKKMFLALTTSRPPLATLFVHRRCSHHGLVLIQRVTLKSDVVTKILSKKRRTVTVSAPSCRWSKLPRDQNNGFNRASTLCPLACLLPPFLPCAVAEVICLLGTESITADPAQRCGISEILPWSISPAHWLPSKTLSSFQIYQFLVVKRDYRTKLTTAELKQIGLETELVLTEQGKNPTLQNF